MSVPTLLRNCPGTYVRMPARAQPGEIRSVDMPRLHAARASSYLYDPPNPQSGVQITPDLRAPADALNAAEHAQLAARAGASLRADGGHPVVHHLSAAADHLAAGRDLLQTHLTPAGTGAGSSPWAPVITSPPVTTALIAELARYARRLAPWMSQLALARTPDPAVPAPACLAPHTASGWLRAAGPAMVTAAAAPAAGGRPPAARRHPGQHPAAPVPARRHRNDRRAVRGRRQHRAAAAGALAAALAGPVRQGDHRVAAAAGRSGDGAAVLACRRAGRRRAGVRAGPGTARTAIAFRPPLCKFESTLRAVTGLFFSVSFYDSI